MKLILAAGAMVLAAGAADAAVIRYSIEADMALDYAVRYDADPYYDEGTDISSEYAPTLGFRKALFEIDTSVFTGGSIRFSRDYWDDLPAGITPLGHEDTIWYVWVEFNADLGIDLLRADFDDGGNTSYSFRIDSWDASSSANYTALNIFQNYPWEDFSYGADRVDLILTPVEAPAPVPLPASALLLLSGLAGAGALKLRRKE